MDSKKTGLLAALATIFSGSTAIAQDSDETLSEIVVTANRSSFAQSLQDKRASNNVSDTITGRDVLDFPDLNVSEALARIPGVTIDRRLGEGQQVSVRGLAPRFTRVTINGLTVPSGAGTDLATNGGREVDFDVFASELFSQLSLAKSPTASMTEGGLAATIDLRTARPFDFRDDGPQFRTSIQAAQNDLRDEWEPRVSALFSTKSSDGRVGFLVSAAYSETSLRQDNAEGLRFRLTDVDVDGDGTPDITDAEYPFIPRYLLEMYDRERLGVTAALQLQPTDEFDLNFDLAYAEFDSNRTRTSIDGLISGNDFTGISAGAPTVDSTGLITQVILDNVVSRSENIVTPEEEDLLLFSIDGGYRFADNWEIRAKLGYSEASRFRPEVRSVWQTDGEFTWDLSDRIFYSFDQTTRDFNNPADFIANQHRFETFDVEDEESAFQVDLTREFDNSFWSSVEFGLRYSDRQKTQTEFDDRFTVTASAFAPTLEQIGSFPVGDFFTSSGLPQIHRTWFVPNVDAALADPNLVPPGFTPTEITNSFFNVEEETLAGYVQLNFDSEWGTMPVRGNIGVRYLTTDQIAGGLTVIDGTVTALDIPKDYDDLLPSLNLVLEPADDFLVRIAASQSLTRAPMRNLTPGGSIQPTGLTASTGNPQLDPFTADQFDLSLEWYFAPEALASLTYFYKDVDGFVTNITFDGMLEEIFPGIQGPIPDDTGNDTINSIYALTVPVNGEAASVKGFEASFQTPFTFLPPGWDNFGILVNYTYADSESTILFNGVETTTLFPGQSETSYNIVGYWENEVFSTRFAYTWRDSYLREVRPRDTERSNFIDDYGQLDLNIQWNVTDWATLTFDGLNLLDEEEQEYGETTDRNRRYSNWGRFYILGVRLSF